MAILPDLATAALGGVVAFLVVLGFLVIFVEGLRPGRALAFVIGACAVAAALAALGETGLALLAFGVPLAVVGSLAFEWLTTR